MQTAATVEAPIARRTKPAVIRLRPDQTDVLREAKFDLMAKLRAEVQESDILQRFFDEAFPAYLKGLLTEGRKKDGGK